MLEGDWVIKKTPVIFYMWYDFVGLKYTVVTDYSPAIEGDVVNGVPEEVMIDIFNTCSDAYDDGTFVGLSVTIKDTYIDDISTNPRFFANMKCPFCEDAGYMPDIDDEQDEYEETCVHCGDDGYYERDVVDYETL